MQKWFFLQNVYPHSKLDFVARFTTNPATEFDDANYQPMQDIVSHALLQPAGMDFDHGVIESILLLDIRGVEIGRYSLSGMNSDRN